MRYPKPQSITRRVILNSKVSQRERIAALKGLANPSRRMLLHLLADPQTPSRLLALAAKCYQLETARKELWTHAKQANPRTHH
jgi:hypothetical protein